MEIDRCMDHGRLAEWRAYMESVAGEERRARGEPDRSQHRPSISFREPQRRHLQGRRRRQFLSPPERERKGEAQRQRHDTARDLWKPISFLFMSCLVIKEEAKPCFVHLCWSPVDWLFGSPTRLSPRWDLEFSHLTAGYRV
ncbi:hypothetical protein SAY86_019581 [Trapa natans]|uniref:Uncharacterized protein n=1 Tax=Trapa natans TaxID=22666 RepID=A0AAN7LKS8_TRANT|nr:hypothetical protein SAY86_019581 [Trapa natans]